MCGTVGNYSEVFWVDIVTILVQQDCRIKIKDLILFHCEVNKGIFLYKGDP